MPRAEIHPADLLAALPLFRELGPTAIRRIAAGAARMPLARGQRLFAQGETPAGFYVVVYGQIGLYAGAGRGRRLTGLVGPGRSFGEPIMFLGKPTLVEAVAQADALVVRVPRQSVFDEIERNPAFARKMLAGLAARIEALVRELDTQARGDAQQRLVQYLLKLPRTEHDSEAVVTLPAPKAEIASQLGMRPEHLSRLLRGLANRGLIRVQGAQISIPDAQVLTQAGEADR